MLHVIISYANGLFTVDATTTSPPAPVPGTQAPGTQAPGTQAPGTKAPVTKAATTGPSGNTTEGADPKDGASVISTVVLPLLIIYIVISQIAFGTIFP